MIKQTNSELMISHILQVLGPETVKRIIHNSNKFKYYVCPGCHKKVNPKDSKCKNCKILLRTRHFF